MPIYKLDKGKVNGIDIRNTNPLLTTSGSEITIRLAANSFPFLQAQYTDFIDDAGDAFETVADLVDYWNLYYVAVGGTTLTEAQVAALDGANGADADNPLATMDDLPVIAGFTGSFETATKTVTVVNGLITTVEDIVVP